MTTIKTYIFFYHSYRSIVITVDCLSEVKASSENRSYETTPWKGTKKEPTERVSLPKDIARWIKQPESITKVRALIAKKK